MDQSPEAIIRTFDASGRMHHFTSCMTLTAVQLDLQAFRKRLDTGELAVIEVRYRTGEIDNIVGIRPETDAK